MIVSHVAAYFLAVPDPHARGMLLVQTGHNHWGLTSALMVGTLVWAFLRYAFNNAFESGGDAPKPSWSGLWIRLLPLQVCAFVVMEATERLSIHQTAMNLFNEPAVIIGVALQAVVALLGALLLIVFFKVVERILTSRPAERRRETSPSWVRRDPFVVRAAA